MPQLMPRILAHRLHIGNWFAYRSSATTRLLSTSEARRLGSLGVDAAADATASAASSVQPPAKTRSAKQHPFGFVRGRSPAINARRLLPRQRGGAVDQQAEALIKRRYLRTAIDPIGPRPLDGERDPSRCRVLATAGRSLVTSTTTLTASARSMNIAPSVFVNASILELDIRQGSPATHPVGRFDQGRAATPWGSQKADVAQAARSAWHRSRRLEQVIAISSSSSIFLFFSSASKCR